MWALRFLSGVFRAALPKGMAKSMAESEKVSAQFSAEMAKVTSAEAKTATTLARDAAAAAPTDAAAAAALKSAIKTEAKANRDVVEAARDAARAGAPPTLAQNLIGKPLKFGVVATGVTGTAYTLSGVNGDDPSTVRRVIKNMGQAGKDVVDLAGEGAGIAVDAVADAARPPAPGTQVPSSSGGGTIDKGVGNKAAAGRDAPLEGSDGEENRLKNFFNSLTNPMNGKLGAALQPVTGFLKNHPIIAALAGLFGIGAMMNSNNTPFMRMLGAVVAWFVGVKSGLFDMQGSGGNVPSPGGAVGGADAYMARQPHTGEAPIYPEDKVVEVDIGKPLGYQLGGRSGLRPEFAPG